MTEHVPDERLAEYSKGLLMEPQLESVEEHLLICERCRVRLTEFDNEWGLNGKLERLRLGLCPFADHTAHGSFVVL